MKNSIHERFQKKVERRKITTLQGLHILCTEIISDEQDVKKVKKAYDALISVIPDESYPLFKYEFPIMFGEWVARKYKAVMNYESYDDGTQECWFEPNRSRIMPEHVGNKLIECGWQMTFESYNEPIWSYIV